MVKLIMMNEDDFEKYMENAVKEYAAEKVKAGTWCEHESLKLAQQSFNQLLAHGLETAGHYLFTIIDPDSNEKVGSLWFKENQNLEGKEAFIYDFLIFKPYQGQGYGRQSLVELDKVVKKIGITKISLHVFAHNEVALKLYGKMGFFPTDINMSKIL